MTKITPALLMRQRNFFLWAIALVAVPALLISICGYCYIGFDVDRDGTIVKSVIPIIMQVISAAAMLALIAYGFNMGRKGYLKKYVAYTFAVYGIYYVVCRLILPHIPAIKQMIDAMGVQEKSLYLASFTFISMIVMIISVKGSDMSRLMKWIIWLGYFFYLTAISYVPYILFNHAQMDSSPMRYHILPRDIVCYGGYLVAALLILLYYNRRIKNQEAG